MFGRAAITLGNGHISSLFIFTKDTNITDLVLSSLHFAWVVDDAKCTVVTRVCVSVCLCVCPRPYAHTTARTRM